MKNTGRSAILVAILGVAGVLLVSSVVWGGEPTTEIKAGIDKIVSILTDPRYEGPDRSTEKKNLLRKAVDESFNWKEMARRSLGIHWRDRSESEREQFVRLFSDLLERNYVDKVDSYSGEEVVFVNEMVDGDYATVNTNILTKKNTEIAIHYRLLKTNGRWRVYDIVIEGVSLVNNYRSQFNSIIARSSFEELLEKIRAKQNK